MKFQIPLIFCMLLIPAWCSNVNIGLYPESLQFRDDVAINATNVVNIIAASLGYSTESSQWRGLAIKDPFSSPVSSVIFDVPTGGVDLGLDGMSYGLVEDLSMDNVFAYLHDLVITRALRPLRFKAIEAEEIDGVFDVKKFKTLKHLKMTEPSDAQFLREISLLTSLDKEIKNNSQALKDGQDFYKIKLGSFAPLVKNHGKGSPQVSEAVNLLREALEQATASLKKLYDGKVLVITVSTEANNAPSRRVRSLLQSKTVKESAINVAAVYDEDYPVIFNIILILTIIFFVSILAVSMSMAMMDPGRDSIIYRMTNPRMKKD